MINLFDDRRGVSAIEFAIVAPVLIGLLLPLTDLALAARQYIQGYQALRAVGAYTQYNPPPDITKPGSWTTTVDAMLSQGVLSAGNIQILCGDPGTACTAAPVFPRTYVLSASITITPLFVTYSGFAGPHVIQLTESF